MEFVWCLCQDNDDLCYIPHKKSYCYQFWHTYQSYILYNIGLIYSNNGDFLKAVEYYQQALDLNARLPQALNNIAVIYHYQGTKASEKKEFELAQNMFDKAGDYWKSAVRLAPNNYIEAQNWLKINGKMAENEIF